MEKIKIPRAKLALVLLMFLYYSCGSDIERKYYEDGQLRAEYKVNRVGEKDGYFKLYYPNGQKKEIGHFKNGKKIDTFKEFYKNGNLKWWTVFEAGKPNGLYKRFYEDGSIKALAKFKDGEQHGLTKHYYRDGELKKIINYKNDLREGKYISFFQNGTIKFISIAMNDSTMSYIDFSKKGKVQDAYFHIDIKAPDTVRVGDYIKGSIKIFQVRDTLINDSISTILGVDIHGEHSDHIRQSLSLDSNGVANFKQKAKNTGIYAFNVNVYLDTTFPRSTRTHTVQVVSTNKNGEIMN